MTIACTKRRGARECVSGREDRQRELNRRLKLDLLITAGNVAAGGSNGSDGGRRDPIRLIPY